MSGKSKISISGSIDINKIKTAMEKYHGNRKDEQSNRYISHSSNSRTNNARNFNLEQQKPQFIKKQTEADNNKVPKNNESSNNKSKISNIVKNFTSNNQHFDLNNKVKQKTDKQCFDKKKDNDTNSQKNKKNIKQTVLDKREQKKISKYSKQTLTNKDDFDTINDILPEIEKDYDKNEESLPQDDEFSISESEITKDEEKFFGKNLTFTSNTETIYKPIIQKRKKRGRYADVVRSVVISDEISVKNLADLISEKSHSVIRYLAREGMETKPETVLDADTADLVATGLGHIVSRVNKSDKISEILKEYENLDSNFERPPVVSIMGHVDHGKTTLLDQIRKSDVASKEKGGITQSIGAYNILVNNGKTITFVDTPGHVAFYEIRKIGAQLTDIVILLIAADDGILDQTIEAIKLIQSAETEIIVVINKIDKDGVNPKKIKDDLLQHNVIIEEFGGHVPCVEISAKNNLNIDKLLESILLHAEIQQLVADKNVRPMGYILESKFIKNMGLGVGVIIKQGTLKKGDIVFCNGEFCKIKCILDCHNKRVEKLLPGEPGEIFGFNNYLESGSRLFKANNEKEAKEAVLVYKEKNVKHKEIFRKVDLFAQERDLKKVNIVLKADTYGSLQALKKLVEDIKHDDLEIKIISSSIGMITESDINTAKNAKAFIAGFNTPIDSRARNAMKSQKVDVLSESVIYKLVDEIASIISGKFDMKKEENFIGKARVKQVFTTTYGYIAGCIIENGKVLQNCLAKVKRREEVFEISSSVKSIRRFKDEVKEITSGYECGVQIVDNFEFKEGDVIEFYEEIFTKQEIKL